VGCVGCGVVACGASRGWLCKEYCWSVLTACLASRLCRMCSLVSAKRVQHPEDACSCT
jgi:hypothetical protein